MSQSLQDAPFFVAPRTHSSAHAAGAHLPAKQPAAHVSSFHVCPEGEVTQYERVAYAEHVSFTGCAQGVSLGFAVVVGAVVDEGGALDDGDEPPGVSPAPCSPFELP
ncbi:MAG: hypothetical protein QM702_21460 [Rubrivivax sp.]